MSQVIIGYSTEGPTDVRFLESVIQRTFEEIAFECDRQIEVLPITYIEKLAGPFVEQYLQCLQGAYSNGIMAFCIHVDADDASDKAVLESRIFPLKTAIASINDERLCKIIVPVIPVQMTESWMLADIQMLKAEMGTTLSDIELGLHRKPESYADPKAAIKDAIRKSMDARVKRRRRDLQIGELYQPLGRKIPLQRLRVLDSFLKFENEVRKVYELLNYLH